MATAINIIKELDKINYQKHLKVRAKKLTSGGRSLKALSMISTNSNYQYRC